MKGRWVVCAAGATAAVLLVVAGAAAGARSDSPKSDDPPANVHHDVSPPLSSIAPAAEPAPDTKKDKEPKKGPPVPAQSGNDPVVQSSVGSAAAPALGVGFEGVGQGFSGPSGTFSVNSAPPDPNATVGPSDIVEVVNESFAIFDKSGRPLYGPVATNTLWSGFGGGCETNDDGDATVEYDKLANRWIFSQFSVSTTPYLQCVAVSTTGDPMGAYYRYSFQYANFPDYPKLGVWPDAYYTTFNMFKNGQTFVGPEACAYDRAAMLAGQPATQQCFALGSSFGSLLPSDLDGSTPPPSGSPNFILSFATNSLQLWKFHVDWANPANTTLSGPTSIPVASFSPACNGGTCIPQAGTTQQLDSLADRLMYRLAYRKFADHESLVVDHSVTTGSTVGVRWYELRDPNGTPTVYQQGTYAPDATDRWMGSIAMDQNGDIGLGFSTSSASLHPGIHYTGRLASDPVGTMTQGEGVVVDGAGSQSGNLSRWGDYTSMSVDPVDDCTFWYTDEYLAASGSFNWHTRIASFKLPGCGGTSTTSDFSITASPSSLSLAPGASASSTITTAVTSGSAQTVNLSASGQPAGATVSFSPTSVTAGGSSTMTVAVGASTAPGSYTITVSGSGSTSHTTTVGLTVTASGAGASGVVNGGFEQGTLGGWSSGGMFAPQVVTTAHSGTFAAQLGSTGAVNGDSTLSQTVAIPSGTTQLSFWYQPHCPDTITFDQIQAQIRTTSGATLATVLNVCSNSGAWTNVTYDTSSLAGQTVVLWFNDHDDGYPGDPTYFLLDDVTLGVFTPPPSDFSISAGPSSVTVAQGSSGTSTISTAVTSGAAETVALTAAGAPAGTSVSFSPQSVTAGGSSTMTIAVAASATPGSYPITVTGTGATGTHTTTVTLTVQAPAPTFTLNATPTGQTVARGGTTTYTVTVTPQNGFSSAVSLSVTGLPNRTSGSFSPNPDGTSTLTVSAARNTHVGTYQLTITGTGGGVTQTTPVTLTVS